MSSGGYIQSYTALERHHDSWKTSDMISQLRESDTEDQFEAQSYRYEVTFRITCYRRTFSDTAHH